MMRRLLKVAGAFGLVTGAYFVPRAFPTAAHETRGAMRATIPRPLQAAVPKLLSAKTRVYLPSWLPAYPGRIYKTVIVYGNSYTVQLYNNVDRSRASEIFFIAGTTGDTYTVSTDTKPVWLTSGGWGFIDPNTGGNMGATISRTFGYKHWNGAAAQYTYTLGAVPPGSVLGYQQLARMANSLVRIH